MDEFISLEGQDTKRYRRKPSEPQIVICAHCAQEVTSHPHCKTCEIMIHKSVFNCHCGKAHTLTEDGIDCVSCVDIRINGRPEYDLGALGHIALELSN